MIGCLCTFSAKIMLRCLALRKDPHLLRTNVLNVTDSHPIGLASLLMYAIQILTVEIHFFVTDE